MPFLMSRQRSLALFLALGALSAWHAALARAQAPAWAPYRVVPNEPSASLDNVQSPPAAASLVAPAQWVSGDECPPDMAPVVLAPAECNLVGAGAAPMLVMPIDYDTSDANWHWRVLPADVIWSSYWAGVHEPRIGGTFFYETNRHDALVDPMLGGRASILRYGTEGNGRRPVGWEVQIEGAALPRLNLKQAWDLDATDFRFGVPLIYGRENWQWKIGYYHLSSHVGDELMERTNSTDRINFSRDALATAISFYPLPAWRWYAEVGWAFYADENTDPWEFQFGVDVAEPGPTGPTGTPFFAINGHLRQEHNFGGNVVAQAGWLWRGPQQKVLRVGGQYYNGKSNQFETSERFEQQLGAGAWYDF